MKKKIIITIVVLLIIAAGYAIYRWARFAQLPDGSPEVRPIETNNY